MTKGDWGLCYRERAEGGASGDVTLSLLGCLKLVNNPLVSPLFNKNHNSVRQMSGNVTRLHWMFILTLCLATWSTLANKTVANGTYICYFCVTKQHTWSIGISERSKALFCLPDLEILINVLWWERHGGSHGRRLVAESIPLCNTRTQRMWQEPKTRLYTSETHHCWLTSPRWDPPPKISIISDSSANLGTNSLKYELM